MITNNLKQALEEMEKQWHKLLFLCNRNKQFNTNIPSLVNAEQININYILSEQLINVEESDYPFKVERILSDVMDDRSKLYYLQHIDILFDSKLKINPVKLLENLSKVYKLIVDWPGEYKDNTLIYGEYGHPEYFTYKDFEGSIFIK